MATHPARLEPAAKPTPATAAEVAREDGGLEVADFDHKTELPEVLAEDLDDGEG